MRVLDFIVPDSYDGSSMKGFLRGRCHVSARLLAKLKRREQGICLNGLPVTVLAVLHAGDRVRLLLPEDDRLAEAVKLPFPVLYEDADVIAVNKPDGMPVHPSPGHDRDSLANAAAAYFALAGETLSFRPVYRLDRDTTGVVLLAKNSYAAARLAGGISKDYFAVCEGHLTGAGVTDAPVGVMPGHTIQRCVREDGARAVTHWKALAHGGNHTLLRLRLETGRTHQIRVHFSHMGFPLAGDDMYGGSRNGIARQALHCGIIHFSGPADGRPVSIAAPFPPDLRGFCVQHGLLSGIPACLM